MAPRTLLDTHVVLWVYTGKAERLSEKALQVIEGSELATSPIVELELAFLNEIGKVSDTPSQILGALASSVGLSVEQIGFGPLCSTAAGITWTRDPFDRMLAAHAIAAELPLITKDRSLLENLDLALWD